MNTKVGGIIRGIYPNSSLSSVKRFKKGIINQTYSLKIDGKELVLRIYPKELWKAKKEKHLYNLISKKTKVPVPKIISSGKNYILMSKIEGKELQVNNKSSVRKAGELLAKIHAIKFPYYGWIINKEIKPKFKRWIDFINYDLNLKLKKIPQEHTSTKNKIKTIINENKKLLDIKSKPCLLHKDFHSSHIIVDKGKINGIIDLEWAMAGHNEFDLAKSCLWMFEKNPRLEKIFLQGYKRHGSISEDFNKRKKLYKLLILLSSLSFSYKFNHKRWCIYNLKKLRGVLNEYHKTY